MLHVAAFFGRADAVTFLLENGANPDVHTIRGQTPLHFALGSQKPCEATVLRLLDRGCLVKPRNEAGQTCVELASSSPSGSDEVRYRVAQLALHEPEPTPFVPPPREKASGSEDEDDDTEEPCSLAEACLSLDGRLLARSLLRDTQGPPQQSRVRAWCGSASAPGRASASHRGGVPPPRPGGAPCSVRCRTEESEHDGAKSSGPPQH